jgi:hypothetical protein
VQIDGHFEPLTDVNKNQSVQRDYEVNLTDDLKKELSSWAKLKLNLESVNDFENFHEWEQKQANRINKVMKELKSIKKGKIWQWLS